MGLVFHRIKIFNLMRSHQISKISHFRIKYEYSVFHLKEKISRHAFFPVIIFMPFVALVIKGGEFSYFLLSYLFSSSFRHDSIIFPKLLEYIQTIILQYIKILRFLLQSRSFSTILSGLKVYQILFVHSFSIS